MTNRDLPATAAALDAAIDAAIRQIPPAWPLASSVAVNPFLGQIGETLPRAGARLARVGGIPVTMPRTWYREQIAQGTISASDLDAALAAGTEPQRPADLTELLAAVQEAGRRDQPLPGIAELAARADGTDWPAIVGDRIGAWAASYFDEGQALWPALRGRSAWAAWCTYATHDLTPEIMGLSGFARFVAEVPQDPKAMIARALATLGLAREALETYLHQTLLALGGWAQYARYLLWQAELAGGGDATLVDLLAIRLAWDEALFLQHRDAIGAAWQATAAAHAEPISADADITIDTVLQDAAERAAQRRLATALAGPGQSAADERPRLQAAFCIDVRSEVFRRALESVDPAIRTLGFAGFFGLAARHRRFASDAPELHLPVLLNPAVATIAGGPELGAQDLSARYKARARRAWGRFKLAAVSSFAFVEATGPLYFGKLLRDALGLNPAAVPNDPAPRFDPPLDLDARIGAAGTILRAMSLTKDFARVVLLVGHGANVVNNPHASGLHCGACGGYSGEVNARLLASLLNDPEVRAGLAGHGVNIPGDTLFVAALHDTTTDRVTLYEADQNTSAHGCDLAVVRRWLAAAGELARAERALRLPRAGGGNDVPRRARDWAEVRPEWGLAGCQAFIAAPRRRTAGRKLDGRAFLHDYDWRHDAESGFAVLELILTAPVVVASWISLQYYGSAVAPAMFGSGNKLLHNVVGGIGVLEGHGGPMRAGLAWQSVHDGERLVHEPLRLSVCVEAPVAAVTDVLARHPQVRALFENGWLHLFAIDEDGQLARRYCGNLDWTDIATEPLAA